VTRSTASITGIFVGAAISLAAVALALRWAGWQALLEALANASYLVLVPAAAIYLVSMVARGLAWRVLLGKRTSLFRTIAAMNEGYLLNNLLPWRMGELGRAILLGRRPRLTPVLVLSSIVIERLLDMVLAVGLLITLLPIALRVDWASRAALLGALATSGALGFLWVVMARPMLIERLAGRILGGGGRWRRAWASVRDALSIVVHPQHLLQAFGWMAVSWGLAAVEYWVVLRGFVPEAPFSWALFTLCVTLLGVAVPSAPGYVGVFEASAVAALAVFGVGSGSALAFAVILHALHFGVTTLLGALALGGEGETLAGVVRATRAWLGNAPTSTAD
jgi:uncharacterized protein (TIRG00374 family)